MLDDGPDPDRIRTRADFGDELTKLREAAGHTVRELAARAGIPAATVGGYLRARHLPSAGQLATFRALLAACDVTAGPAVERWLAALSRARAASDARSAHVSSPYPGLAPFRTEDAATFFGRARAVDLVLAALRRRAASGGSPLLAVVGPSGSGKSSLLHAGVIPAVAGGALGPGPTTHTAIAPGEDPCAALAEALNPPPRLLVIDQFEELFTLCRDDAARQRFLAELAVLDPARTLVVIGLRADFYAAAAREPLLVEALQHAQIVIAPMTSEELREAILGPATQAGATVEPGLADLLLSELAPRNASGYAHDPGALPLLSHALLATWRHSSRRQLNIADYRAIGGLDGAVQQSAEEVYRDLEPAGCAYARRLFQRLVTVGDDTITTRRRVDRLELDALTDPDDLDAVVANAVLDRFVERRLLTVDVDSVQVSHDALLTAWPRLREWLDADRDGLRLHRQLTNAANGWDTMGRDPGALLRGARLAAAVEWASDPANYASLNRTERDFLDSAVAQRDAELGAARHHSRRLQHLLVVVCVLALGCAGLAVAAFVSRAHADSQRREAELLRNQALSRQVAVEAAREEATDPDLAAQLALTAYRISPTSDARSMLIDSSTLPAMTRVLGPPGTTVLAPNADGSMLAVSNASTGAVTLYRPKAGTRPAVLGRLPGPAQNAAQNQLFTLAFSPDGRVLATGGSAGIVTLWDVTTPAHPRRLGTPLEAFGAAVHSLAFSPDGHTLIATGTDPQERRWDVSDPAAPVARPSLPGTADASVTVQASAYSPDGGLLALGGTGTVLIWHTDALGSAPVVLTAGTDAITQLSFGPNGGLLAAASKDGSVYVFDVRDPAHPRAVAGTPLTGFSTWVNTVQFSADGRYLAAAGSDTKARVWSTATWRPVVTIAQAAPVTGLALSPDGSTMLTTAADGSLRLTALELQQPHAASTVFTVGFARSGTVLDAASTGASGTVGTWTLTGSGDGDDSGGGSSGDGPPRATERAAGLTAPPGFGLFDGTSAMSADGTWLAAGSATGRVQVWNLADPSRPSPLGSPLTPTSSLIEALAISPDGHVLAAGADDAHVYLWDVSDPAHPRPLPALTDARNEILNLTFSADGHYLAAASADTTVRLWDVHDPAHAHQVSALQAFDVPAFSVAISPDGDLLAAGGGDDTVRLWDISDPAHPRTLGAPLTGPTNYAVSLAFSPDGHTLAVGSSDGTVWLWDVTDAGAPAPVATLRASGSAVDAVAFSPDGHTLAAGGAGGAVTMWDTSVSRVQKAICRTAGSVLTKAEWRQYVPGATYDPPCR